MIAGHRLHFKFPCQLSPNRDWIIGKLRLDFSSYKLDRAIVKTRTVTHQRQIGAISDTRGSTHDGRAGLESILSALERIVGLTLSGM